MTIGGVNVLSLVNYTNNEVILFTHAVRFIDIPYAHRDLTGETFDIHDLILTRARHFRDVKVIRDGTLCCQV